jgi:hypothetical protein
MNMHWEMARERQARLDRLSRDPRVWRRDEMPAALDASMRGRREITLRREAEDDAIALARLAELTDRPLPARPLLLVEADGRLLAARSLVTDEAVADPFATTADVRELLALRAGQLGGRRSRFRRLLPRAA